MSWQARFSLFLLLLLPVAAPALAQESYWSLSLGPRGVSVFALAFHPSGDLLAGTDDGVFRLEAGAESWIRTSRIDTTVHAFALTPQGIVYAAGEHGVYVSADAGLTWQPRATGLEGEVLTLEADDETSTIYAGTSAGLFQSTDIEQSWGLVQSPLSGYGVSLMGTGRSDTLYAGDGKPERFYLSPDAGNTWTNIGSGLQNTRFNALHVTTGGRVLVGLGGGLYILNDAQEWQRVSNEGRVTSFDEGGEGIIYAASDGGEVIRSADGGLSWTKLGYAGLKEVEQLTSIAIDSDGVPWIGAMGAMLIPVAKHASELAPYPDADADFFGGVFMLRANTGSWAPVREGLTITRINTLAKADGEVWAGTGGGAVAKHGGGLGLEWLPASFPSHDLDVTHIAVDSGSALYAGGHASSDSSISLIYRTDDDGQTWADISTGLPPGGVSALAADTGGVWAATYAGGLLRSTDGGQAWTADVTFPEGQVVTALVPSNGGLYAGTSTGAVFLRPAGTTQWQSLGTGIPTVEIAEIVSDRDGALLAATLGAGIYQLQAGSTAWEPVNEGLTNVAVTSLAVSGTGDVLAGTQEGVFRFQASTDTWARIDDFGRRLARVEDLVITENDVVIAATPEAILQGYGLVGVGVEHPDGEHGEESSVVAYPNPTSGRMHLRIRLPQSARVVMNLYDVLGRQVLTVFDGPMPAGETMLQVNLSSVVAGVYLLRTQTMGHTLSPVFSQKIILLHRR